MKDTIKVEFTYDIDMEQVKAIIRDKGEITKGELRELITINFK